MNAAIIKVSSRTGGAAASLWLGAAGLSLCGVFMVQYYSIRAFPLANSQLRDLVSEKPRHKRRYISRKILAIAISGPPLMTFWATALFVAGIIVYIWETQWDRTRYQVFAFVPVAAGGAATLVALIFGEILGTVAYGEVSFAQPQHCECDLLISLVDTAFAGRHYTMVQTWAHNPRPEHRSTICLGKDQGMGRA
jgi:hypothetical protein